MTRQRREPQRIPMEPRAFTEGTIAAEGAGPSAEEAALAALEQRFVGALLVELVQFIPDGRHRSAVQLTQMEGISYADAADLMSGELAYTPDPKTVWEWAKKGLAALTDWVEGTPWLSELAPHLPVHHEPERPDPVPFDELLAGGRHGEPAEEEGHREGGADC